MSPPFENVHPLAPPLPSSCGPPAGRNVFGAAVPVNLGGVWAGACCFSTPLRLPCFFPRGLWAAGQNVFGAAVPVIVGGVSAVAGWRAGMRVPGAAACCVGLLMPLLITVSGALWPGPHGWMVNGCLTRQLCTCTQGINILMCLCHSINAIKVCLCHSINGVSMP